MFFSNLRLGAFLGVLALIIWRVFMCGDEYWPYIALQAVVSGIIEASERIAMQRRVDRLVAAYRRLGPEQAESHVRRIWSGGARRELRDALRAEGSIERDGATERFPMAASERAVLRNRFWMAVVVALASFATLLVASARLGAWGWACWALGLGATIVAGWMHEFEKRADALIEVSPFAITRVQPDGVRESSLRWTRALILYNEPKRQRFRVADLDDGRSIEVEYGRVGVWRAFDLVVEYGGFRPSPDPTSVATPDQGHDAPRAGT